MLMGEAYDDPVDDAALVAAVRGVSGLVARKNKWNLRKISLSRMPTWV